MEQFEITPKHETRNDETIAIADIFSLSLLWSWYKSSEKLMPRSTVAILFSPLSLVSCIVLFYAFSNSLMYLLTFISFTLSTKHCSPGHFCRHASKRLLKQIEKRRKEKIKWMRWFYKKNRCGTLKYEIIYRTRLLSRYQIKSWSAFDEIWFKVK